MARQLLNEDQLFPVREADLAIAIDPDPDALYWLRPITTEYARSVYKQHTTRVPNRQTHQMEDRIDTVAVSNTLLDYCVVKWEGVGNPDEPCDLAHKLRLPTVIQAALIERAQLGEVTPQQRAASFRAPA